LIAGRAARTAIACVSRLAEAYDGGDTLLTAETIARDRNLRTPFLRKILSGLARAHVALGDHERARAVLETAPEDKRDDPALAGVYAQLELADTAEDAGEVAELAAKVDADPDDLQARYDLAVAQVAAGRSEEAIDTLLELFVKDREWNDGAAKQQLFKLFEALGPKNAAAQKGRRRLSSMIFA